MRIDGLPNLSKVTQSNQRSEAIRQKPTAGRADSVEISRPAKAAAELTEALKTAPEQPNPRIGEIRERVRSGYYDSEDVRRQIAGVMMGADGLRPVVNEVAQVRAMRRELDSVPDTRADRVAEARERAGSGFYDQPQVRAETAQRIIDEFA